MDLKDKVALVTGASRGMGRAIALALAREGARVAINYRSNQEEAEVVVNEIVKEIGGRAVSVQADVGRPEEVREMFNQIQQAFGGLDVLVNNAGIEKPKPFGQLNFEEMEAVFHTNLLGLILVSQAAVELMKDKGGKIVNIASVRGFNHCGRIDNIDYSASKAGVINFTQTLAKAVAPKVLVTAVAPGPTETDMAKTWSEDQKKRKVANMRIGRLMQPAEIARAVVFLAKEDGLTGEVLVVDGGYSLGWD